MGRILDLVRRQHFDRTAPSHEHVFGQVHRSHSAFAQQGQQPVLAEEEPFVLALQQLVGLPLGQHVVGHKFFGNGRRTRDVRLLALEFAQETVQRLTLDQSTLLDNLHERVRSEFDGHLTVLLTG